MPVIWSHIGNADLGICLQVQALHGFYEQDTNTKESPILRDLVAVSILPSVAAAFHILESQIYSFGTEALFSLSRNTKCYTHFGCLDPALPGHVAHLTLAIHFNWLICSRL